MCSLHSQTIIPSQVTYLMMMPHCKTPINMRPRCAAVIVGLRDIEGEEKEKR